MSIGYHSPLSHLSTPEVDRELWQAEQDRAAAAAWEARCLAAAREGDGWCLALAHDGGRGNQWLPYACAPAYEPMVQAAWAEAFAREERRKQAANLALDAGYRPDEWLVDAWIDKGYLRRKDQALIDRWLASAPVPAAAPAAFRNNPFAALAALKG